MKFSEKLNEYISILDCTAGELCRLSGLSAATLSRYRSGERTPRPDSAAFRSLCASIAALAAQKQPGTLTEHVIQESFLSCGDMTAADPSRFRQNLDLLLTVLAVSTTELARYTHYEQSTLSRIRSGSRQPSDLVRFAISVAEYVSNESERDETRQLLSGLLGCTPEALADPEERYTGILTWLLENSDTQRNNISPFLSKLDSFNLNEYIKAVHFDELKVPSLPFQLPTSKSYFGLQEMMESELDFLKATVLSKSTSPVTMFSDMPLGEMADDPEFPKKWMYGMALMLKKGLHLNQIHNLDRSFEEMMLGLESWIPMYMTGQISPYYLKDVQNDVFLHLLKVSGAAALSGEAISGHQGSGKYYLTKAKDEIAYYTERANALLSHACPLMDIYRSDNAAGLSAFLNADSRTPGRRRNVLSTPPLYTMEEDFLTALLERQSLSAQEKSAILAHAKEERQLTERILQTETIVDEIPCISREEFERYPMTLSLSGIFLEKDIPYTWADYQSHLAQTKQYAQSHPGYVTLETASGAFRNLQIVMHEGEWAMVSKGKSPAIHFVIHHPKLRSAIEKFTPPLYEGNPDES